MKKLLKFLLVTLLVLTLEGLYFEFVFSREFDFGIGQILTIFASLLGLWYIFFTSDFVMDLLKLNNKQNNNQ